VPLRSPAARPAGGLGSPPGADPEPAGGAVQHCLVHRPSLGINFSAGKTIQHAAAEMGTVGFSGSKQQ